MKRITAILGILTLSLLFILASGCEGPAGAPGKDGQRDTVFVTFEGFASDIKCTNCHSTDSDTSAFMVARRLEYQFAGHMTGTAWVRGLNSTTCASCHITEGYLEGSRSNYASQATKLYQHGTQPNCFTCHSPHARGNFTLRKTDAIKITSFVAGAPDVMFDVGTSNTCVTCHRTRETSPMTPIPDPTKTAATDSIVITSSRFYPHYGVQGQMLLGKGGFEFAGYTYPSSFHTTMANAKNIQCASCHMATPIVAVNGVPVAGGHTLNVRYLSSTGVENVNVAGCRASGCHTDITANTMTATAFKNYRTAQSEVVAKMDTLKSLLVAKNWLDPVTDLAKASTTSPLVIKPAYLAGALFNYFFLEHEGSHGIHNTKYAKAILDASIAELKK